MPPAGWVLRAGSIPGPREAVLGQSGVGRGEMSSAGGSLSACPVVLVKLLHLAYPFPCPAQGSGSLAPVGPPPCQPGCG